MHCYNSNPYVEQYNQNQLHLNQTVQPSDNAPRRASSVSPAGANRFRPLLQNPLVPDTLEKLDTNQEEEKRMVHLENDMV